MTSPASASNPAVRNPPAVLSAAQRHDLARMFERAKQLAARNPPDYRGVHRVLSECCTLDPGNTLFVAALLENLEQAEGKIASAWFWQVWAQRQRLAETIQGQRWGEALTAGWWLLGERPQEVAALISLAAICAALDHLPTQVQLLQAARKRAPSDTNVLRLLAKSLEAAGQFTEATATWNQLQAVEPGDEVLQHLHILAPLRNRSSVTGELGERVRSLVASQEWEAAQRLLEQEAGAAGENLELRYFGEEIRIGQARERTEIARQLAAVSTDPAQQRLVSEILEEQRRIELGVAYARYERFSAEPSHIFELATALNKVANFSESLKYLDQLSSRPEWRLRALILTAENWQQLRQFDRALAAYRQALDRVDLPPQDEFTQRGWHRGAVLAEAMGQPAVALAWLERLVAANPVYKDASARLDNLRLICNKGGFSAGPEKSPGG